MSPLPDEATVKLPDAMGGYEVAQPISNSQFETPFPRLSFVFSRS